MIAPSVIIFDDDAVMALVTEYALGDFGIRSQLVKSIEEINDGTSAIIVDWIVPTTWNRTRNKLISYGLNNEIPVAVYSAGGTSQESLDIVFHSRVKYLPKDSDGASLIDWLKEIRVIE